MKFSEMQYTRPDVDKMKSDIRMLTEELKNADSYSEAKDVFLRAQEWEKHFMTQVVLVMIRHAIDTRDEFYNAENSFWNKAMPDIQACSQSWDEAMLSSRWRPDFEKEYGNLMFLNTEIQMKAFSPEIVGQMQRENELKTEYGDLIASAQVPFEGHSYTLAQMEPFKNDSDDSRRLAAWKADGQWYKDHQPDLDRIYDDMVKVRDDMGKKLGYDGFTQLGYYRMGRNCYTKEDLEKFRKAVVDYVVPIADRIRRDQAKRMGFRYPMSYDEEALEFRSGNPKPCGTAEDILAQGKKFYEELSPETGKFFNMMLDDELMDVLATEGKAGGGYCTSIPDYNVPFIFANFNGTRDDVKVITHEAGHAFEMYMNRDRVPVEYVTPSMEACEVHSMSMEFFAWPWAEGFFGEDTRKFYYSHLSSALTFIPYGTAVDHFQHIMYDRPELTPKQRHQVWKELLGVYMPWLRLDGEIPFYGDGESWQFKHHIYDNPFYYIDYCLAQTVSLEFWAMIQNDKDNAWEHYMAYTRMGGSKVFTDLLKDAGLESPFDEECLRSVCQTAGEWLDNFDLTGIE